MQQSQSKFEDLRALLPKIERSDIDLPEIQEVDSQKIIEVKLKRAFIHHKGEFIVEDTSLCFDALNGLPGPFIKWFLKTIGTEGLYKIAQSFENMNATARTII